MTAPLSDPDLEAWLAREGRKLVALDYDGTLAPIVDRPEDAHIPDPTKAALLALLAHETLDVAIVTGRSVEDLDALLAVPDVWRIGRHGGQLAAPHGAIEEQSAIGPELRSLLGTRTKEVASRITDHEGAWLEDKGSSVALHTRACTEKDERAAQRAFEETMAHARLELVRGKRVVEARPMGIDKGRALRELMGQLGSGAVLFVGDDVTDEDAFAALAEHEGALTVKVGDGDTQAHRRVLDPTEVRALLERLCVALEERG